MTPGLKFGKIRPWVLFLGLMSVWSGAAAAAVPPGPEVAVTVRAIPDRVTLGDEIRLFIRIDRPVKFFLKEPSDKIQLTPFEIKKIQRLEPVVGVNRAHETILLTLTAFELGDLRIPPVPIEFVDERGRFGTILTQSIPVRVSGVAGGARDTGDIRPIKAPYSFDLTGILFWLLAILALILKGLLGWTIFHRVRPAGMDPELFKPPHERALLELGRLRKRNLLSQNQTKAYYTELADIIRRYLERRYQIRALEETSGEILMSLRQTPLEAELLETLRRIFGHADLVKFAEQMPSYDAARQLEVSLVEFVEKTKPVADVPAKAAKR